VGDRFPQFVLADEMGNHYESAWLKHRPVMLVYCASRNGLSSEQASEIARFRQQLEAKMAINSVAVVTSHDQTICEQAREICGLVLVDEDRRLRPLAGSRDAEVSICLLDRYGYIRMRADLPASGVTSSSSKDRLITGSLAILDESITLY